MVHSSQIVNKSGLMDGAHAEDNDVQSIYTTIREIVCSNEFYQIQSDQYLDNRGCPGQLVCTSTNPTGPEVNS